ncbi:hypothetical protein CDL15_Pgr026804 [Punica granatum]|uniref:DUF659 domain-containing protein n=1 Tax=Punica granatum TaxID=22663 RepID=A0A218WMX3_PUNGR|nr:hypothetical protein CDL15_Pgr026804 [Punica granatum]
MPLDGTPYARSQTSQHVRQKRVNLENGKPQKETDCPPEFLSSAISSIKKPSNETPGFGSRHDGGPFPSSHLSAVDLESAMPSESDKWGWKHVSVFGGFDRGSGTKRWKCNHCNLRYNGSYSRVRAHLLGFAGVGVKSCPAIDRSLREAFQVLEEERLSRKKKKRGYSGGENPSMRGKNLQNGHVSVQKGGGKEAVDDLVARFFYAEGLNVNAINSPYFQEMTKAMANFGPTYELPSMDMLSGSLLSKQKERIEKSVALIRESWPHTGCSISCVGRPDGTTGCLHVKIFVGGPRGLAFMKSLDMNDGINCGDDMQNELAGILGNVIVEVGPANVVQIISNLSRESKFVEPLQLVRFPHIFWSPCTSSSIHILMEEIAELDCLKQIFLYSKEIEQCLIAYQRHSSCMLTQHNLEENNHESLPIGFMASYRSLQRIFELKQALQEAVLSEEWKMWKTTMTQDILSMEAAILGDEFWTRAQSLMQLFEPFLTLLSTFNVEKSTLGDVHDFRVRALEFVRSTAGINGIMLSQLEALIDRRWDELFSPLHAAGYILNPRFFGRGQNKDRIVMRGWKAMLEKYESESTARRVLREELSFYWRFEGSFGEEDAIDCRDKMDPVAWWENFGFETPHLQTVAIRVLSQNSSIGVSLDIWETGNVPLAAEIMEDLVFVQNGLRLQNDRIGILSVPYTKVNDVNSNSLSIDRKWDIAHLDQTKAIVNDYQRE